MSSEDDQCFQCQELGHIACHCPNIRCFDCNEYRHIAVDCPDRIPPKGTPACHKIHHTNTRHCTRPISRHCSRERHRYNRSRSQSHSHGYQSHSHNNSHRSHSRSYHRCPHRSTSCHWSLSHKLLSLLLQHTTQEAILTEKLLHSFQRLQQIQNTYVIQTIQF